MSDIWHLLIHSNTLNFFIVLALIIFVVVKLNLKQKIETLRDEIKYYVETSEQEKIQAEKELENIKNRIEKLPEEIDCIRKSAENSVENFGEKIRAEIDEQKQDISKNAERLFNLETKKFKSKLTNLLSEKSIELVKENALNQLNSNKELHNKYIDNAISELDRVNL